jgi:hypothetical protein
LCWPVLIFQDPRREYSFQILKQAAQFDPAQRPIVSYKAACRYPATRLEGWRGCGIVRTGFANGKAGLAFYRRIEVFMSVAFAAFG